MPTRRVDFPGHSGATLAARLDLPEGEPRGAALFAHCFTCSKDLVAARRIADALSARGFAVLRFDFTGLGHSEGEFASTDFSSNVADLNAAAHWMENEGLAPTLLIGHSLGGAAALAAAGGMASVRAVATLGAPSDPAHVLRNLGASLEAIREAGEAEVELGGRRFTLRRGFVEDVSATTLSGAIAALRRPLLILHAPRDETVGIDEAAAIFKAAKHPKSFVSLDDADHLLSRPEDAEYAAAVILAWAGRYAAAPADRPEEAPAPDESEAPPEGVVRATEAGADGYRQDILAGPHPLAADEPASVGGGDTAPTPYGLLSAALAACTSMTVRMYARRKALPLDKVTTEVRHEKIHARDCEDCEARDGRVDRFDLSIRLEGELSDAQRARLLEIAGRCPVHRTLKGEVTIRAEETRAETPAAA